MATVVRGEKSVCVVFTDEELRRILATAAEEAAIMSPVHNRPCTFSPIPGRGPHDTDGMVVILETE